MEELNTEILNLEKKISSHVKKLHTMQEMLNQKKQLQNILLLSKTSPEIRITLSRFFGKPEDPKSPPSKAESDLVFVDIGTTNKPPTELDMEKFILDTTERRKNNIPDETSSIYSDEDLVGVPDLED